MRKPLLDLLKLEADAGLIVGADAKAFKAFFAAIAQHRSVGSVSRNPR